jgi:branched-chain amino acid transport system substrate-binding protein
MNVKTLWPIALLMVILALVACAPAAAPGATPTPAAAGPEIRVGSLNDMTGPTSDVGKDYALAIGEAIRCAINDAGGINGKPVRLFQYDYGYRVPEAVTTYKRFRDFDKVVAVLGWGTGDTSALAPTVHKDQLPYISASYAAELTDPTKFAYNFFAASDYSSNARAAMTAWYGEVWQKDPRFEADRKAGKPRVVMFYSFPTPYSSAPIKALKEHAALLGFEVGPDQDVALTALDTKSQVLAAKEFKPHLVWHGNTTMSVATALKDAKALGLGADHIINNWGYDENLPKLAGDAAEGAIGIAVNAFFGENVSGMDKVKACAQKYNPGVPLENRLIRTVQAWGNVLLTKEALLRADKAGQLNGPGIKAAIETMKDLDLSLGIPKLTYTADDHRPTSQVRIYRIKGGKFELLSTVDLKAKWPDQWPKWKGY